MKIVTLIAVSLFTMNCFGQTKLISHRSHSGSDATFHTAVENDLFDNGNSNFGLPYESIAYKVDTVLLNHDRHIMTIVRSAYMTTYGKTTRRPFVQNLKLTPARESLFINNRDSLKLFIIKDSRPVAKYNLDSTVFIGFDNKQLKRNNGTVNKR